MSKAFSQKEKNQLNYKVLVADHGMETVRDQWGNPTGEQKKRKVIHVLNMFQGKIEEYELKDSWNRIKEVREDPDYKDNDYYNKMSDYQIMNDYMNTCLKGNGSVNANVINDNLMANREAIEKYIQDEVRLRLEMELKAAGIKKDCSTEYVNVDFSGEHI